MKKKGSKHVNFFTKTWGDHPKNVGTTIKIQMEEISQ
jgi:hypothetical protein